MSTRSRTALLFTAMMGCATLKAQTNAAALEAAACGQRDPATKIETVVSHASPSNDRSKATLIFIADQLVARPGVAPCLHCGVPVLLGMDGAWVTAGLGFSHSIVTIPAGEHHLCSAIALKGTYIPTMFGFRAEAGKAYYLKARLSVAIEARSTILELSLVNDDEGRYLEAISRDLGMGKP